MPRRSGEDKVGGAKDKLTGKVKETAGTLTGNENKKAEGRADQDRGTLKKKKGQFKDLIN